MSERSVLQGVRTVCRFNWPSYAASGALVLLLLVGAWFLPAFAPVAILAAVAAMAVVLGTLAVTAWVYDFSGLYELGWIQAEIARRAQHVAVVVAGFDEVSEFVRQRCTGAEIKRLDLYEGLGTKTASIQRAHAGEAPLPLDLSESVALSQLKLDDQSADLVVVFMSAHEIRNMAQRIVFFRELQRVLQPEGTVLVVEHLRDLPNFVAYWGGAFHFLSRQTWLATFAEAGLLLRSEAKHTPFVSIFELGAV